jgi:predicted restriction endonuclease
MDPIVVDVLSDLNWFPLVPSETSNDLTPRVRRRKETEREALTKARVGQGPFRLDVIALWGCCAVTGCVLSEILIASHIVPWKVATKAEKLDHFNGLLLTPNLDRLFDKFLITFNDDGSILLSKSLTSEAKAALGVSEQCRLRFVRPAMLPYLRRHRRRYLELEESR